MGLHTNNLEEYEGFCVGDQVATTDDDDYGMFSAGEVGEITEILEWKHSGAVNIMVTLDGCGEPTEIGPFSLEVIT